MIALSTGSLYTYGLARVFALAAETGFDGIEVMVDKPDDNRNARYLASLSERNRIPIVALHSPFVPGIPGWPDDQLGRLEHTVTLAQELGVPVVVMHLPYRVYGIRVEWFGSHTHRFFWPILWPRRKPYYYLLRDRERWAAYEADSGVHIAVENMPAHRFLGVSVPLYWFNHLGELAQLPHLTLDTTHIGTWGMDLLAVWDRLGERVAHIHLANFDGQEHRLPTHGDLPLGTFLSRLAADGYEGEVSVECGPKVFEAENEDACRRNLAEVLAFCREHYR